MRVKFSENETVKDEQGYRIPGSVGEVDDEQGNALIKAGLATKAPADAKVEAALELPIVSIIPPAKVEKEDENKLDSEVKLQEDPNAPKDSVEDTELVKELMKIPSLTEAQAMILIEAGVTSVQEVKDGEPKSLATLLDISKKDAIALQKGIA
jgi:hypothetical protein